MNPNLIRPLIEAFVLSVFAIILHGALFYLFNDRTLLPMSWTIYGGLFGGTLLIMLILILVKQRNPDSVGYAFLLLTCLKMAIVYFAVRPYVNDDSSKAFFILAFMAFLLVETISTIRMLNRK